MNDVVINDFLKNNNGQITWDDAKHQGIPTMALTRLVNTGRLERVARGVYIDPAIFEDDLYILQYRFKRGIFYKDTSLFLHGMIDRTPDRVDMNFPQGYNSSSLKKYPINIQRQIEPYYSLGIEEINSPGQHLVKVYNIERTLCDLVRTRNSSDSETIKQAMVSYSKMKSKDLGKLSEYAQIFNVQKAIQNYMEVLL
ncbi:type IV toxin-antitoxin system AbiEi family antitoxin domain-containing protein [Companilactobacillus kimchiensis]|uniref:Abortive infection protein AbiGI n=1 Tax=Companilactobacillus kimchiensis TaxID=993692 RepID=A0A0R2LL37_9LACO|nr:type IV toxin-antitoxin system AbiEi family antitoxin domain-containing protein [Companilactobacillus kimchiensis]KRO00587.1 abortive infection protein AbiGI [Companilactobacillus kimchiensis]